MEIKELIAALVKKHVESGIKIPPPANRKLRKDLWIYVAC